MANPEILKSDQANDNSKRTEVPETPATSEQLRELHDQANLNLWEQQAALAAQLDTSEEPLDVQLEKQAKSDSQRIAWWKRQGLEIGKSKENIETAKKPA